MARNWTFMEFRFDTSWRPRQGTIGRSVARQLRMIGWVLNQEFSPARAQHGQLTFESVAAIWPVISAATGGFGVDEPGVRSKDNALAGFAQPQTIIDIVESDAK